MMKYWCIIFALFSSLVFSQSYLVEIQAENSLVVREHLVKQGFDVAGYNRDTQEIGVITQNPKKLEKAVGEMQRSLAIKIVKTTASQPYQETTRSIESYYNPEETVAKMQELAERYPQWVEVFDLNEWLGVDKTFEGRSLYGIQISSRPEELEDEPKVLLIGQHHCRELMTHHAVLDAAEKLLQDASKKDPQSLAWIESSAVWCVPVVNPDGLDYVFKVNNMWRKNRVKNADGFSHGVDLNRNYEFQWGFCGTNSSYGSSDVYKGPSAMSEPEVQVMDRLNARLRAQYVISYHSYGDEILHAYKCGNMAEELFYFGIRDQLAKELGYAMRYASSSGEDFEHHYNRYGSISFLIEIGRAFQPSYDTYQSSVWPSVQKILPFVLNELHKPGVHIKVTDAKTGANLSADIKIEEIVFKENEIRKADSFGSFRWRYFPGKYNFTVSMPGYTPQSVELEIKSGTTFQTIHLAGEAK